MDRDTSVTLHARLPKMPGEERWRRWESNPRPETLQNDLYVCSLCFEDSLRIAPTNRLASSLVALWSCHLAEPRLEMTSLFK